MIEVVSHEGANEPKQRRWRGACVLVFVIVLASLAIFWVSSDNQNDPIFEGKRLSDHLYEGYQPFMLPPGTTVNAQALAQYGAASKQKTDDAATALRDLGPRAVPLILQWMSESPKSFRMRLNRLAASNYPQWGWLLKSRWVSTLREHLAFEAANKIPQHCEPLVPLLCQQIISEPSYNAVALLDRIIANVPLAHREKLLKDNWRLFDFAVAEVSREGSSTFGNSILTELYKYLSPGDRELLLQRLMPVRDKPGVIDTMCFVDPSGAFRHLAYLNNDLRYRKMWAVRFFGEKPLIPDLVVPALVKTLKSDDVDLVKQVCRVLGNYGANALSALPALRQSADGESDVAAAASNAIARIEMAQSVRTNTP